MLLGAIRAGAGLKGSAGPAAAPGDEAPLPPSIEIPFSRQTKQVLLAATGEADQFGHAGIGVAHLLLGLLGRRESIASFLLTGWGMDAQRMRRDIVQLRDEEPT